MKSLSMRGRSQIFGATLAIVISIPAIIYSVDESAAEQTRISGAGGYTCRIFAERAITSTRLEAIQWTIGYLSGRITADPGAWHRDFHGVEGITQAVIAYCRRKPHAPIVEAADWFFE
ncbi:hypothetical protein [Nitrobacter sp.]|uniref:hypothetical protein n=1 Tax=Nitrobacter sp. TaxID=29420 RepID=UPI003F64AB5E